LPRNCILSGGTFYFEPLVPNSTTRTPATGMLYNTTNGQPHNNSDLQLVVQQCSSVWYFHAYCSRL